MYLIRISKTSEISATANHCSRITSQGDDEQIYCQKKDSKTDHLNLEDEYQIQPPTNEEITAELQQEDIPLDLEPSPDNADHWVRRSTQLRCPTQRDDPSLHQILLANEGEPLTLKEARRCEHSNNWELAMQAEIKSLHENNTSQSTP